jgi:hypothetical protein
LFEHAAPEAYDCSFIGDPRPFCNQKLRLRESASIKGDARNAEKAALAKKESLVRAALCTERHIRKVPFKLLAAQSETDALPHIFILVLTGNSPFSGMGASRDIAVYNFGRNQTANGSSDYH